MMKGVRWSRCRAVRSTSTRRGRRLVPPLERAAPRVIGHGSDAGPGGDPDGDLAVWSDGSELVVYDTAAQREVSRTSHAPVSGHAGWAYVEGNAFKEVSSANWWRGGPGGARSWWVWTWRTGETTKVWSRPTRPELADLHEERPGAWSIRDGRAEATTLVQSSGQEVKRPTRSTLTAPG